MLSALRKLWNDTAESPVENVYIALVARARNPFFYTALQVPDTLDGRFELIVLHLFLLQHRLLDQMNIRVASHGESRSAGVSKTKGPEGPFKGEKFGRQLSELFFADMDRSLREIGVADTGVRYRIKAMAKAYHGRLQVYASSLDDPEALRHALARNLYGTLGEGSKALLSDAADYVRATHAALKDASMEAITSSQFIWPEFTRK